MYSIIVNSEFVLIIFTILNYIADFSLFRTFAAHSLSEKGEKLHDLMIKDEENHTIYKGVDTASVDSYR